MGSYDWNVKNVTAMTDAKLERSFKRVGAYIRSDARHSIRQSVRNSKPGDPPLAKSRKLKNTIVFAADKAGVVVGPVRYAPADSTPHILEFSGWRTDTLGRIRARWAKANPQLARQQKMNQQRRQTPSQRPRSQAELEHIKDYYKNNPHMDKPNGNDNDKKVRFFIARRPFIEPAYKKNKQKTLALLQ